MSQLLAHLWQCWHISAVFKQVLWVILFLLHLSKDIFPCHFRSVRHMDIIEDSYYLRRNHSSYIHVLKDDASHEEMKSLFLGDFYSKVVNVVGMTKSKSLRDSWPMWTKSPCDNVPPQLTNVWTQFSGFRKGFICFTDFYETIFKYWLLSLPVLTIFLIEAYWRISHVESSKGLHNIGLHLVTY